MYWVVLWYEKEERIVNLCERKQVEFSCFKLNSQLRLFVCLFVCLLVTISLDVRKMICFCVIVCELSFCKLKCRVDLWNEMKTKTKLAKLDFDISKFNFAILYAKRQVFASLVSFALSANFCFLHLAASKQTKVGLASSRQNNNKTKRDFQAMAITSCLN